MYIDDIGPETEEWTVEVMVVEKSYPKLASDRHYRYQRLVSLDAQGSKVQATIFGENINILADTLEIFKTYNICNAEIQQLDHKFQLHDCNYSYQWTIYASTPIEEIQSKFLTIRGLKYDFVPLNELKNYVDTTASLDVLFAVLKVDPPKRTRLEKSLQNISIIDQGMQPMMISLWEQFIENEGITFSNLSDPFPIVLGVRMKATSFNGLTLQTRNSTTFVFHPPLPEADALRSWCAANARAISQIQMSNWNQVASGQSTPTAPTGIQIKPINHLPTSVNDAEYHYIRAKAKVGNFNQRFWYKCCPQCNNSTDAGLGDLFHCNYCKKSEKVESTLRCRFDLDLQDDTRMIAATIFGDHIEKLFAVSAADLHRHTIHGNVALGELKKMTTHNATYIFYLKAYKHTFRGISQCKFNVVRVYDKSAEESPECSDMIEDFDSPPPFKRVRRQLAFTQHISEEGTSPTITDQMDMESPNTITTTKKNQ